MHPQRGHSVELDAQLVPQFEQVEQPQPVDVEPLPLPAPFPQEEQPPAFPLQVEQLPVLPHPVPLPLNMVQLPEVTEVLAAVLELPEPEQPPPVCGQMGSEKNSSQTLSANSSHGGISQKP